MGPMSRMRSRVLMSPKGPQEVHLPVLMLHCLERIKERQRVGWRAGWRAGWEKTKVAAWDGQEHGGIVPHRESRSFPLRPPTRT